MKKKVSKYQNELPKVPQLGSAETRSFKPFMHAPLLQNAASHQIISVTEGCGLTTMYHLTQGSETFLGKGQILNILGLGDTLSLS